MRSRTYAISYPWIEFALGMAFRLNVFSAATSLVTAIVKVAGLVGVVSAVRKKQSIQCACLGTAFNLPMSVVTIVENSAMAVMALMGLAWSLF